MAGGYHDWQLVGDSVRVRGKRANFTHSLPLSDLKEIAKAFDELADAKPLVTRADVAEQLEGKKLQSGGTFRYETHRYKVTAAAFIFEKEGLIREKGRRTGRRIHYEFRAPAGGLSAWLNKQSQTAVR